ncbi:MAG: hypothetical protein GTO18_04860 [Anaerolineales bacterium]|nr:hypothetical protein [Anaerolineales bacterium]
MTILVFTVSFILVGCSAEAKQWDEPPEMSIDPNQVYLATLETEKGDIKIELFADRAPKTVNNFVFLAEKGFYDDTTFHRVVPGFMAQGGDPTATGTGGPGYTFEDEIDPSLNFTGVGDFAMANSGPDSNGSQFFITYAPAPHLDGLHTIFGKVVEGMDVVIELTPRNPLDNPDYDGDLVNTVTIEEIPESLLPPPTPTPIPVIPVPEEGRPLAEFEIPDREDIYTGKPDTAIDPSQTYRAVVDTSQGNIVIELEAEAAPESVNNFVVLAELGYYDGFPISFVSPEEFLITGSPGGVMGSDIGYTLPQETGLETTRGAVGYWVEVESLLSSGSQLFILLQDIPEMQGNFTAFGQVVEGMDVVDNLTAEDEIIIIHIEVE